MMINKKRSKNEVPNIGIESYDVAISGTVHKNIAFPSSSDRDDPTEFVFYTINALFHAKENRYRKIGVIYNEALAQMLDYRNGSLRNTVYIEGYWCDNNGLIEYLKNYQPVDVDDVELYKKSCEGILDYKHYIIAKNFIFI